MKLYKTRRKLNQKLFVVWALCFLLSAWMISAQDTQIQAFGYTPKTVPDSLYKSLRKASTMELRTKVISEIAKKHLESGNGDSVIHYANVLDKTFAEASTVHTSNLIFQARLEGDGNYLKGLYDKALKSYLEGVSLDSAKNQLAETRKCLLGVGRIYLAKGELEKANEVILECTQSPDVAAEAFCLLGVIHYVKKDFETSRNYYDTALKRIGNGADPKLTQRIQLSLGNLEYATGNHDKALDIYEEIISSSIQASYYDLYTEAVVQYGRLATKLGYFDQAEMTLSMAYTNAIQWNRLELQKRIINVLRKTYQQKGDYKNAYNLMTHYLRVSSEIDSQQNSQIVSELEVQYQTLRKENQILQLKEEQLQKQNELERQKTIKRAFLYGFLIILIPILALLYVYYQKLQTQSQLNLRMKELNAQKMGALIKENELMLTKTSLDAQQEERRRIAQQLHDSIGSNLAGIKLQLANLQGNTKDSNLILNQIDETYRQVRDISHDLIPKKFTQDAFSSLLSEYLENIGKSSGVEFEFSVFPEQAVDTLKEAIKIEIYAIVQELITNTLKHANAKSIELHINLDNAILSVLYEDDGVGFDTQKTSKGIGLSNIEDRLTSLNGHLNIDSILNRGTAVTIEIPIESHAA
ncbi:MAG: ATP-binding protein [Bacteroidota bacterium]